MADTKRDESRDLYIGGGFYPTLGGSIYVGEPSVPAERTHYVPYSELESALARIAELELAAGHAMELREPAVPRCRTCSFYEPRPGYESVCNEQCPGYEDRREVPNDGSGYCHAHQETRHA